MSFIYCHEDERGARWFYQESEGFREKLPGSSSSFTRERERAYRFDTKEAAWEHCRKRRVGGFMHGLWIVIKEGSQRQGVESPTKGTK